jgi:hypothetical protein
MGVETPFPLLGWTPPPLRRISDEKKKDSEKLSCPAVLEVPANFSHFAVLMNHSVLVEALRRESLT